MTKRKGGEMDYIESIMQRAGVPGLSLSVVKGGKANTYAFGIMNQVTGQPMT